jgi:hypothetical protein
MDKDWKLKLRYGKSTTPYKHYTVIAPVMINKFIKDFSAKPGTAYIAMKVWATDTNEAVDILESIGNQKGYVIIGNIEIYNTDPKEAPSESPDAYDINFNYYEA